MIIIYTLDIMGLSYLIVYDLEIRGSTPEGSQWEFSSWWH